MLFEAHRNEPDDTDSICHQNFLGLLRDVLDLALARVFLFSKVVLLADIDIFSFLKLLSILPLLLLLLSAFFSFVLVQLELLLFLGLLKVVSNVSEDLTKLLDDIDHQNHTVKDLAKKPNDIGWGFNVIILSLHIHEIKGFYPYHPICEEADLNNANRVKFGGRIEEHHISRDECRVIVDVLGFFKLPDFLSCLRLNEVVHVYLLHKATHLAERVVHCVLILLLSITEGFITFKIPIKFFKSIHIIVRIVPPSWHGIFGQGVGVRLGFHLPLRKSHWADEDVVHRNGVLPVFGDGHPRVLFFFVHVFDCQSLQPVVKLAMVENGVQSSCSTSKSAIVHPVFNCSVV